MRAAPVRQLRAVLKCLDSVGYAVAKNSDIWQSLERGGDWDLVVVDPVAAEDVVVAHLGHPHRAVRRSYVSCYLYPWGEIDLLSRLEWRGVEVLSARRVVDHSKVSRDGVRTARPAHEAVAAWLLPAMWGGSFKERYATVVSEAAHQDGDELADVLQTAFGTRWGGEVLRWAREDPGRITSQLPRLRAAAASRALTRRPIATMRRFLAFTHSELLSGGRGSTTVIQTIQDQERFAATCDAVRSQAPVVAGIALVDSAGRPLRLVAWQDLHDPAAVWSTIAHEDKVARRRPNSRRASGFVPVRIPASAFGTDLPG